ncbi:SRPBCC domain-containing protein [Colwellia echini]|uniref:ATPase n=1 Tax=Colwellia echini TaxID=1982103 RepID=A0ABY3N222_9GAMM|nr:SRPBCC domain-containing protein [Colwellia echini]TYK67282.1 ATPase [Colwellia echini]
MKISIETIINAPLTKIWSAWTTPEDIKNWNFATNDWCCPTADINLAVGGKFTYQMAAKDGSMAFDFSGEFIEITPFKNISYKLEDNRTVLVSFIENTEGIKLVETFDAEDENSGEQQRQGWLLILENFKQYVENK